MPTRTQRAVRLPPDERRAAIVAATLPLVLRHGAATSTRQIAEAAGVAEGTIFRVFPDKDALMRAVVAQALDPEPTLRGLADIDRNLPVRDRLVAAAHVMQRRLSGAFGLIDALGLAGPPGGQDAPEHRRARDESNAAFVAAITDVIGPDHHRLRVPAPELARILRLLVFAGTHPRITDDRPLHAEQVVAILLDGLMIGDRPC